ncbi:MAG: hypothetical protein J4O01_04445 [Chloroflexi bacterium]|nr:hypothetical protein [Chloroflexota bacterium]MCH8115261.1 hypothetical protein [Chloroflexota bacterium]MCI0775155.1 hypothetical protein [Chloroflexota bacterium]MCI0807539.1 hypothetical protein [Chloroflexota bacterium]MCI0833620.1 hypothetical protein [Chloroflexota bacterium]
MGWKVFATAPDQLIGESWCGLVEAAGINCKLQPGDVIGFMGVSMFPVRLMTRSEDVERARSVLESYVGEDEQPPDTENDIQ